MPQPKYRTESKEMTEKMPFQIKSRVGSRAPMVNSIEAAKLALPFFGGTAPDAGSTQDQPDPEKQETKSSDSTTTTDSGATNGSGGDGLTPEAIAALVAKNLELENSVKETSKKLENYTKQEQDAEKAKLGEVERAQVEIRERDETIMAMDKVIRDMAVQNAIVTNKDLKFHSAKHVINELDPTEYEIDVDLNNGTATVSNLEKALKRIAEANPWMVVDAAKDNPGNGNAGTKTGNQNPGGTTRRGSGAPPSPGASRQSDATQRRSELMKKFPVIARGARTG